MNLNTYDAGGILTGGFTFQGMTLTGPLLLSGTVGGSLDAIHKQYLDSKAANLVATNFIGGNLPAGRLPAFTGDAIVTAGSNIVSLNTTGLVAGDYTKVTVDSKGRGTLGGSLVESDLPSFDFSKITSGLPATAAGYGITDGLNTTGGTLTGNLTLSADPVAGTDAVTKQYADTNVTGGAKLSTGDIIANTVSTTPNGFLRCNGGNLSKTTYSALYTAIGDAFTNRAEQSGSGQPWRQQYNINTTQTTDISSGGWSLTGNLASGTILSTVLVTKSRVYLVGGNSGTAILPTVQTAPINTDGTLGSWTTSTNFPIAIRGGVGVVSNNKVYVTGGNNDAGNNLNVYSANINSDGTLGAWGVIGTIPTGMLFSQAIVCNNRIHILGGVLGDGSASSTVYTSKINSDGSLSPWALGTNMAASLAYSTAIVTKNRVYVIGGMSNSVDSNIVQTSVINPDGTLGVWSTTTPYPVNVYGSTSVVTNGRAFVFAGVSSTTAYNTTYNAAINTDGTLSTWSSGTGLATNYYYGSVIVTSSKIYLFAGADNTGTSDKCYSAAFVGGSNDYSIYYTGYIVPVTDSTTFNLPDYSGNEKAGMFYFIKT